MVARMKACLQACWLNNGRTTDPRRFSHAGVSAALVRLRRQKFNLDPKIEQKSKLHKRKQKGSGSKEAAASKDVSSLRYS